jgi:hypothetical protein
MWVGLVAPAVAVFGSLAAFLVGSAALEPQAEAASAVCPAANLANVNVVPDAVLTPTIRTGTPTGMPLP